MSREEVSDYLALVGDIADIVVEANIANEDSSLEEMHADLAAIIADY